MTEVVIGGAEEVGGRGFQRHGQADGRNVVLEIKGQARGDRDAKHEAARRWVRAVNHWGRLGQWEFLVCREPQKLGPSLRGMLAGNAAQT